MNPIFGRAREVIKTFLRCNCCEQEIYTCSDCGESFTKDMKIACVADGLKHKCAECAE